MTHLFFEIDFVWQLCQDVVQIVSAYTNPICPFASATTNKGETISDIGQTH